MSEFKITSPQGNTYKVTAPEGATNEQVLSRIQGVEKSGGVTDYLPEAVSDIPDEIGRTATNAIDTIKEGMFSRKGEQGVLEGTLKTGKALAAIPALIASPITGALKSLIGHPMAKAEHAIGSVIAPQTAAKDSPEEMYKRAADDVETALSGLAPGRTSGLAPGRTGAGALRTAAPYEAKLEETAFKKILNRINQDVKSGGPTAKDALGLVNEAAASGKPLTLTDVGGENLRGLAGNVSRQPGPSRAIAKQFLEKRDEGAAQRLSADIDRFVSGGPGIHKATETLLSARSQASKPAYEAARSLNHIWSPRLAEFFNDPVVKTGLARGFEIERLQSLAEGRPITSTQMGIDVDVDGNVKLISVPNMRLLDMAKQGLDAMIAAERNEITGRLSARGVALNKMREAYVSTIDDLDTTGAYKKARETWGGYSQSLDALRNGRTIFQKPPAEIENEVSKLSKGNQEFYRLGVADVIRERLAKTGLNGDEAKALIKNPWMRDQLKPIFKSNKDFDDFVNSVTHESMMFKTKQDMLGGSPTAMRLAEDTANEHQLAGGAMETAKHMATGSWFQAAKTAWRTYRDLGLKNNPELNEKIAEILFKTPISPKSAMGKQLTQGKVLSGQNYMDNSKFLSVPGARLGATVQGGSLGDSK